MTEMVSFGAGVNMKTCSKCRVSKPEKTFSKNASRKDGLQDWCKECLRAYYQDNQDRIRAQTIKYYRANRIQRLACQRAYRKANRARWLEYDRRYYREHMEEYAQAYVVYYSTHRDEIIENVARWRRQHPEQLRANARAWTQRRRARIANAAGSFTYVDFQELCDRTENKCLCCGNENELLTADHVVPLSQGGDNSIENIQPLCQSCNSKKGQKTIDYRI